MFEESINAVAKTGDRPFVVLIGGTQAQRTAWADDNLEAPAEIIIIDLIGNTAGPLPKLPHRIVTRDAERTLLTTHILAGVVVFGDQPESILQRAHLALGFSANLIDVVTHALVHYVGTSTENKDMLTTSEALPDIVQKIPAKAQTCYAYYRKVEGTDEEYLHHALWHPDTVCDEGERMVPGYFVPQDEFARYGMDEAHREIMKAAQRGSLLHADAEHYVMDALRRVWAPQDAWQAAVRHALLRAGEEVSEISGPKEALDRLITYYKAYGAANSEESYEFTGHPSMPDIPEDTVPTSVLKYCTSCERPEFNGHARGCSNDLNAIPAPADDEGLVEEVWPPTGMFKHTDGGCYEVLYGAESSEDRSKVVVYKHLWPFEIGVWTRPFSEWYDRFTQIDSITYANIVDAHPQEVYQKIVTDRRVTRKAEEARIEAARETEARDEVYAELDKLDGSTISTNTVLYDAHGKMWVASAPHMKGYKFRLRPEHSTPDETNVWWHTKFVDHEGLPVLFWANPVCDLRLKWDQRLLDGQRAWETQTPFGLLQIRLDATPYPWHIHSLFGRLPRGYEDASSSYKTENAAMLAVEALYFDQLEKALTVKQ